MFSLPPLPFARLIDEKGYPTAVFSQYWQQLTTALTGAINTLANVVDVELPAYDQAIQNANAAAAAANAAAANASATAAANAKEQALVNSYIDPASVLTSTVTTISVAAHTRYYADSTHVAVSAGTVATTGAGDTDYVYYSDPNRTGGAVTYQVATTQPPQTGSTHVVGAVMVPNVGTSNGGSGPRKPGFVSPDD